MKSMYSKRFMYDAGRKGCLELLESGFLDAFEETLELIEKNEKIKTHAALGLDKEKPQDLNKDFDVMRTIMAMLRKSEKADRTGAIEDNYSARLELANNLLEQSGYYWLAEYLYKSCYRILNTEDEKDEKLRIKALQLLALLEERRDNHDVALRYMEKAIKLVKETSLEPEDPFQKELFQQLIRMYHKLGTQYLEREYDDVSNKQSKAVFYYKRAVSLAKTNDTVKNQATSYGLLGRARLKFHHNKRALKNFQTYLSLSQECNDAFGICNAYFALSEIYKRMGNLEISTEALTKCQEKAKDNGFLIPVIFSSISFGQLETARRQYLKAYEHFETGYRILLFSGENKPDLLKLCRVMCGVGRANRSFDCLMSVLQEPKERAFNQLLIWRNTGGSFEGKDEMKNDHLTDLNQEETEDEVTKRAALIQKLIDEEKNESQEYKNTF